MNLIIFLSAFLLFQIEPIVSKIILPSFGGSYLVWGACVVFFQAILLLGYWYSHIVVTKFGILRYRYFHLIILILPLFFFPGRALPTMVSHYNIPMPLDIFLQLSCSIGMVFFVLSTTSIILQSWLSASDLPQAANPYILFAASNLGSFIGLLTYPFYFESLFDLDGQLRIWRFGYLVFLGLYLIIFKLLVIEKKAAPKNSALRQKVAFQDKVRWFLFGAAAVIMFLAVTNIITYDIAPVPLLWIIPLCIYLISFVLNFKKNPWYPDWIERNFHLAVGFGVFLFFLIQKTTLPIILQLAFQFVFLFIICMFCQNKLYQSKPKNDINLTRFYLLVSFGGFFGGILVSWVIPLVSTVMIEYLFGLFVISLALVFGEKKEKVGALGMRLIFYLAFAIIVWPMIFQRYNFFGIIIMILVFQFIFSQLKKMPRVFYLSLLMVLILTYIAEPLWTRHKFVYKHRNYYGIYKIYDEKGQRYLVHGSILHGMQYLDEKKKKEPLTYYHRQTIVGKIIESHAFNLRHVGLVGLGTGTLATYFAPGQEVDFFEIDPDVLKIASDYFSFLKDSGAHIRVILGDARLSLEKIPEKRYDLLVIDAFSGDSIPMHLLTKEAMEQYKKCLTDQGVILFHISNRYLDLAPIIFGNARILNAYACEDHNYTSSKQEGLGILETRWVVMTWDRNILRQIVLLSKPVGLNNREDKKFRAWTDKYSNICKVLRLQSPLSELKDFQPFYW